MEKFVILVLLSIFDLKEEGLLRGEVQLRHKGRESLIGHSVSELVGQQFELLCIILELLS